MAVTPNLGITEINATDTGKATEINTALSAFDSAYNASLSINIGGLTTYTLSTANFQSAIVFIFTGALTGNCTINLPTGISRFAIFINQTTGGHSIVVSV